jgi:hypothetical protein
MRITSFSLTARVTVSTLFLISGLSLIVLALFTPSSRSANPTSGTLDPTGPDVTWAGTAPGGSSPSGESTCVEGTNCDSFMLTLSGIPADWAGKKARIVISSPDPSGASDYDVYVHKGDNTGPIVPNGTSTNGGTPPEVVNLDPSDPNTGTGLFSVHVVYFSATAAFQYAGSASATTAAASTIPAAPQDTGPKIGFENFEGPGTLVQVASSSQGPAAHTVEYIAHDAGEPSTGVNWKSPPPNDANGVTNFQSDLQTLFITFDDSCSLTGPKATWYNSAAPTSQFVDSDPIGFTDPQTGRVFAGELTLLSPTCKISFTDTDGKDALGNPSQDGWSASSGPLGSGVDHETIGGGPYHTPIPTLPTPYPNAVYYCSQDLVTAFCLRSDDGGATFGPPVTTYTSQCGGLHGHVKVAPDGTVYLPNNICGSQGAVVVSEDNGITWSIRPVPQTMPGQADPAVGVDASGRVYFAMSSATGTGSQAVVATSNDRGMTWTNIYDVGAAYGLQNVVYPAAVAGDDQRGAVSFYGSTTGGDLSANAFNGIWHLYVAETFDGGAHWTTTDATPGYPMQRGCIWTHGGADICRNLLDFFDMTVDKQGRVEVGYVNGCAGGACAQALNTASGNAYTALGTITRQSSGRRLLAAFDPASPLTATSVPGIPFVTQRRIGSVVHLLWSEADTGNSPVTSYKILRGTTSGGETLLATVPGNKTAYDDSTATDPTTTYYYQVVAVNAVGMSCPNNEIAAPFVGDTCTGLVLQKTPPGHPEQPSQGAAPPSLAIDYIAVAEPPATNNLLFRMKVTNLGSVPNDSRWRIVWDSYAAQAFDPAAEQFFVGMRTDDTGNVTFEYGTIATQVVGLVIGVPTETTIAAADPASNFSSDGTINIIIPKSAVGNPQPGDLLGAVNGRTFTGDTPSSNNLERSTALVDHTFVKGQRDNGSPAATYTIVGNTRSCAGITAPAQLLNISTRALVQTGDNVLIGGFIVTGSDPKQVIMRAIGPSLNVNGTPVAGRMEDPTLELHDQTGAAIAFNDNWKDTQQAEIQSTGLAPTDDRESAILMTLAPGPYTAIMRGKNDTTGIGLVEAYDLALAANSRLANISTRGFVQTSDNVMIGGFIVGNQPGNADVVVRAIGPSLASSGVSNSLQDPTLELHDGNGTTIATNDNWQDDPQAAQVQADQLAPSDSHESALFRTVGPGAYTAIVRGKNDTSGVALVEVYNVP